MVKKDNKKDKANNVVNREIFQRMNFMYQAACLMATITVQPSSSSLHAHRNNIQDGFLEKAKQEQVKGAVHETRDYASEIKDTTRDIDMASLSPSPSSWPTSTSPKRPLSRKKKKEALRVAKVKMAMEQVNPEVKYQKLQHKDQAHNPHPYSGTARFYAATLREIGRKNVIRIGPAIKRSICPRCEAVLIPPMSAIVRVEAEPQLHTVVACNACGAFRRYFCMSGKGIEGDRWEPEVVADEEGQGNIETNIDLPGSPVQEAAGPPDNSSVMDKVA